MTAENRAEQLTPCPFCRSDDLITTQHGMSKKYRYEIKCNNCGASSPFCNPATWKMLKKDETIKAWNTRASKSNDGDEPHLNNVLNALDDWIKLPRENEELDKLIIRAEKIYKQVEQLAVEAQTQQRPKSERA